MSVLNIIALKANFQDGDIPSCQNFNDLIDTLNYSDQLGKQNGIASLGTDFKVILSQLPVSSFADLGISRPDDTLTINLGVLGVANPYPLKNSIEIISSDFTAETNTSYFIEGNINITLPAYPTFNDIIEFIQLGTEASSVNNITISGTLRLKYAGDTYGWIQIS